MAAYSGPAKNWVLTVGHADRKRKTISQGVEQHDKGSLISPAFATWQCAPQFAYNQACLTILKPRFRPGRHQSVTSTCYPLLV